MQDSKIEDTPISIKEAAKSLSVSDATVRNWLKTSVLLSDQMTATSILKFKEKLASGEIEKLNIRANKALSDKSFIPENYAHSPQLIEIIQEVRDLFFAEGAKLDAAIFAIAANYLFVKNEVDRTFIHQEDFFSGSFKRKSIEQILSNWSKKLDLQAFDYAKIAAPILNLSEENENEILGAVYQSLVSEGDKSKKGAYYTPEKIAFNAVAQLPDDITSFLDPCCGTGKYLLKAAAKPHIQLENIYGFDIDAIAVELAKINLLLRFPKTDIEPNVFCFNALQEVATGDFFCTTNHLKESIAAIATNPPWGAAKNQNTASIYIEKLKSKEIFSMFILKSLELLKVGGELSFILPESILKVRQHAKIREIILKTTSIKSIKELGRAFTGVFTPVIELNLTKEKPNPNSTVQIIRGQISETIPQRRFVRNKDFVIDIAVTQKDWKIISKIYQTPHETLQNHASWALGIVTGGNKKHILTAANSKTEPIFKGSDVQHFKLKTPSNFIVFEREKLQQVAKEHFYRAEEKLIYKFISSKLSFAYDNQQSLTLNSANILIPALPNMNMKVAAAFLNSKLFQYLFSKKFSTHKVLRGDLEQLPFPNISEEIARRIAKSVELLIENKEAEEDLNDLVFTAFKLTKEEIDYVISEINPLKKLSLPLTQNN